MSIQFGWFALNSCHCTLGVGVPLAVALILTIPPAMTVVSEGCVVTDGIELTVSVAALLGTGDPTPFVNTARY